jgi:hypothetical protein
MREWLAMRSCGLALAAFCVLAALSAGSSLPGASAVAAPATAANLTDAEINGYLIWLHALEETIAARLATGRPEPRGLFPYHHESLAGTWQETLLDVAHALEELEARPRLLQEPPGRPPLPALNRARNLAHLAAHDSALVWYLAAARRDSTGEALGDIGEEIMAAAVAAGEAAVVRQRLQRILGAGGPHDETQVREVELACRFQIARGDTAGLTDLVAQLARQPAWRQSSLGYWEAFSLSWLGRWSESLAVLRGLLTGDGRAFGLDESERAWVLMAVPDQLLLLGDHQIAHGLYRALGASTVPEASAWAACQAAALDLLAGDFLRAGAAFERLCRRSDNSHWRRYACDMARLSDELERLRSEGRPHGIAGLYQP